MNKKTMLSQLMGKTGNLGIELIACEECLSSQSFPISLLSAKLCAQLKEYQNWLSELPVKDSQELAFATLLSEELPKLGG